MTVKNIPTNIVCLEYRQDKSDKDYGSCLYARFYFNLDRYELMIISDCGNYGYKWVETPHSESFLELMARCNGGYILDKIYGSADIFDYEATKQGIYDSRCYDDEDKKKLDKIFKNMEFEYEPDDAGEFLRRFDEENDLMEFGFVDTFEFPQYRYPANVLKICEIFDECIRPKIREILKEK